MKNVFQSLAHEFPGRIRPVLEGAAAQQVHAAFEREDTAAVAKFLRDRHGARLVQVFGEDRVGPEALFYIHYVFERPGSPQYLLLRAAVPAADPVFPALAAELPSVNWQEREIQDWFGVAAESHPNPRRVALHDNWPDVHPLRKDFPLETVIPPFEGEQHVYRPTEGEGVFHVPVGPVHAGIIEPGHFDFAVAGEPILYLQLRMFYTHKGTEKLFEALPAHRAVTLAESVSGDSAISHATAFCQAVEAAADIDVPFRARVIRTVLLELERVYNHIADIGAIATDVGFAVANAHAGRVREAVLRLNEELTGSRLLRGAACIGGVRWDWSPEQMAILLDGTEMLAREFDKLISLVKSSASTRDRLEHTGRLTPEKAAALGIVGVAGRASGVDRDVRRDHPYAAYDCVSFGVPVYEEGDVWRRMQVRIDEVRQALFIIRDAAAHLPEGPCRAPWQPVPAGRCAMSAVEGWRGEILYWVRTDADGVLERCKVTDPSVHNWPALVEAVQGNIIADFPVINKSFNLSYSGTDR